MRKDSITVVRGRAMIDEPIERCLGKYSSDFLRVGKSEEFYASYQSSSPLLVLVHKSERNLRAYFASNEQARAIGAFANFIGMTGVKLRQPSDWQMDMDAELMAELFKIVKQNGISVFEKNRNLISLLELSKFQLRLLTK